MTWFRQLFGEPAGLAELRDERVKLWQRIDLLELRNAELHELLVKMHKIGADSIESESQRAIEMKHLEIERERVLHGFEPNVEKLLKPETDDGGMPADLSNAPQVVEDVVPGGDDEGEGAPL